MEGTGSIWVVGSRGMLGTELCRQLNDAGIDFVGTDRELDFLDTRALEAFVSGGTEGPAGKVLGRTSIRWIVNCAAYTAVDKAEDEAELCGRLNTEGPANLARLATGLGVAMLHISTDYVFDGTGTRPYREDDPLGPTGVYGKTKAEGELAVASACARSVILRTAWLYGRDGPNFVYTMLRLMGQKDSIGVVMDQRGTPTWAVDLARAILTILRSEKPRYGLYQYTDGGETNWYEFALEIERLGLERGILAKDCRVEGLSTAQYPTKARRPAYSVLSKEKIVADYAVAVPEWRESLRAFISSLGEAELKGMHIQ